MALAPLDVRGWMAAHPAASFGTTMPLQPAVSLGMGWNKRGRQFNYSKSAQPAELRLPPLPCDLNVGLEHFVPKIENSAGAPVEVLIAALLLAQPALLQEELVLSFRNNLNKVCGTVFFPAEPWTVDGCLHDAVLFLDIQRSEQPAWTLAPEQQKFISWGYQFEAKCTGAVTSNPNEEYGVLLRTSLGGGGGGGGGGAGATGGGGEAVRCVLGAEIDAFDPAVGPPSLASHAELKTVKAPPHQGAWRTLWRHRHPKWWLQSHLAGTQKIVLGFRDDGGVIREIHPLRVADLPSISARHGERWSPAQALSFGAACLVWCRKSAAEAAERAGGEGGSKGAKGATRSPHMRFAYDPAAGVVTAEAMPGGELPARLAAALRSQ